MARRAAPVLLCLALVAPPASSEVLLGFEFQVNTFGQDGNLDGVFGQRISMDVIFRDRFETP